MDSFRAAEMSSKNFSLSSSSRDSTISVHLDWFKTIGQSNFIWTTKTFMYNLRASHRIEPEVHHEMAALSTSPFLRSLPSAKRLNIPADCLTRLC